MQCNPIKLWNNMIDKKLRTEQKVDLSIPADLQYPPPSAYAVKQHMKELGLDKPCRTIKQTLRLAQNIQTNIDKDK